MLPDVKHLLLEHDRDVLKIWLNRPESRNALTQNVVKELILVADWIANDPELRIVVFRGKGGFFCAGGDIKGFQDGFQKALQLGRLDKHLL